MINKHKVSIITPTFNSERFLKETYASILEQTHTNWEWVITDDCSSDRTIKIIESIISKDDRVRLFKHHKNLGAASSRNKSLSVATGDFIAFIDSDDLWHRRKLEEQINFMGESIAFSFTSYEMIDENGRSMNKTVDEGAFGRFTYNDMLKKKATLGCSTVILRASSFDKIEMPNLRTGQDYGLWLSILRNGYDAYIFPKVLTKYRIVSNSISRNKYKKAKRQWQIYRNVEKLGLIKAAYCFTFYAWRAVFRK